MPAAIASSARLCSTTSLPLCEPSRRCGVCHLCTHRRGSATPFCRLAPAATHRPVVRAHNGAAASTMAATASVASRSSLAVLDGAREQRAYGITQVSPESVRAQRRGAHAGRMVGDGGG